METNNYQGAFQKPMGSGFNAASTSEDVMKNITLNGKTVILTGGYAGIGLETARALSKAGALVIVPAKDMDKALKNLEGIPNIEIQQMDLSSPESIKSFADAFLLSGRPLDILINNAGIQLSEFQTDVFGNEAHFAVNYLGHFSLTAQLWSALKMAQGARVVNLSSYAHRLSDFNFEDPNFISRPFNAVQAYAQSKTAANLFTVKLDELGKEHDIRVFAAHPGSVGGTDLSRYFSYELGLEMGFIDQQGNINPEVAALLKTVPMGAATSLWCAVSADLNGLGGIYCEDADISLPDSSGPDSYSTIAKGVKLYSLDKDNAERLWKLSTELTGVSFQ